MSTAELHGRLGRCVRERGMGLAAWPDTVVCCTDSTIALPILTAYALSSGSLASSAGCTTTGKRW